MSRLFVPVLAVVLGACSGGRYTARADCEETFACCEELGESIEDFSIDECVATTQDAFDALSADEQQALDDIFTFCEGEGVTGCAFFECVTGSPLAVCPAEFLKKETTP